MDAEEQLQLFDLPEDLNAAPAQPQFKSLGQALWTEHKARLISL